MCMEKTTIIMSILWSQVYTRKHLADLFKLLFSVWLLTWSVQSNLHVVTVHTDWIYTDFLLAADTFISDFLPVSLCRQSPSFFLHPYACVVSGKTFRKPQCSLFTASLFSLISLCAPLSRQETLIDSGSIQTSLFMGIFLREKPLFLLSLWTYILIFALWAHINTNFVKKKDKWI